MNNIVVQNKIYTKPQDLSRDDLFEQLFEKYHVGIYSMCWRYTQSEQDAQDLTQEIYVLIYRKIQEFRGESSLSTWIYRIALNKIYESRRSTLKHKTISMDDSVSNCMDLNPHDEYKKYELSLDISRAVANLPEKYQSVIELYYYQDLAQKDISIILEIPLKTVETRLKRAKDKLESILSTHGIGEEYLYG